MEWCAVSRGSLWHAVYFANQSHPLSDLMTIPVEVLEAEVLSLPQAERSRLLDMLLASLAADPEWEQAWADEADRREAEIEAGRSTWLPGEEVVARMRAQLSGHQGYVAIY